MTFKFKIDDRVRLTRDVPLVGYECAGLPEGATGTVHNVVHSSMGLYAVRFDSPDWIVLIDQATMEHIETSPPKYNDPPWHPITKPVDLKHLGKLGEETGELSRIVSRIIIQGMNGIDPENGEANYMNFAKEMADVVANIELCCEHFMIVLDRARIDRKKALQREWHKDA